MPAAKKKGGAHKVVAPLVAVKDENGNTRHLSAGDIVPDGTAQESIDWLSDLGFIEDADAPVDSDDDK